MWFLLFAACVSIVPRAEVVDACDPAVMDTGVCVPCASDAPCVLGGNPCLETVACMHEDANVAFAMLGCSRALEHRWPDDDDCRCVDAVCAWTGSD